MKITIEYDTREEAEAAMNASNFLSLIEEIEIRLRNEIKHGDGSEEAKRELQEIRNFMRETGRELNIKFY